MKTRNMGYGHPIEQLQERRAMVHDSWRAASQPTAHASVGSSTPVGDYAIAAATTEIATLTAFKGQDTTRGFRDYVLLGGKDTG